MIKTNGHLLGPIAVMRYCWLFVVLFPGWVNTQGKRTIYQLPPLEKGDWYLN
jgi:hypothetical protein